jgi:hypothetical protein
MVAVPLCAYNYVRFDSIFEFGVNYVLTGIDNSAVGGINIFGKVFKTLWSFTGYLFAPLKYSLYFPFAECYPPPAGQVTQGLLQFIKPGMGLVNFPIVFCLLYLLKKGVTGGSGEIRRLSLFFLAAATAVSVTDSYIVGFISRYMPDFSIFIILPSLFCAGAWAYPKSESQSKNRQGAVLALLVASVFTGLFLFVTGGYAADTGGPVPEISNPMLYRYLEYSLGVLRNT